MSDKLLVGAVICVLMLSHGSVCDAQGPTVNRPTIPTTTAISTSLRSILAKMRSDNKLVQGKNLVLTTNAQGGTPAFKLWATVDNGNVTNWQAVDANGKNLPTNTNSVARAAGGIECQLCVTLPDKTVKCYKIDCNDAPKPKPKATAVRQ